ncbi:glomerular parietal epithelial cell differentiation, partial [Branchiostoma belcheri]
MRLGLKVTWSNHGQLFLGAGLHKECYTQSLPHTAAWEMPGAVLWYTADRLGDWDYRGIEEVCDIIVVTTPAEQTVKVWEGSDNNVGEEAARPPGTQSSNMSVSMRNSFRTFCLVITLLLGLAAAQTTNNPGTKQQTTRDPSQLDFGSLPQVEYVTTTDYSAGGLDGYYKLMSGFLSLVSPRDVKYEWIELAMQGRAQEIYKEPTKVVLYSLGWAICAAIGILFIVIMPIVGLCFCCCRCCGNCGGKMQQTVRDTMVCKRRVFEVFLFIVTILIAVGMVFAFLCNDALSTSVTQANTTISGTFQNVRKYFNNTKLSLTSQPNRPAPLSSECLMTEEPLSNCKTSRTFADQLDYIVDQYDTMSGAVNYDLDNIDQTLGVAVRERLRPEVGTAVNQLVDMINTVEPTKMALLEVQRALGQLQTGAQDLNTALADQRTTLNNTLNFCDPTDSVCVNLRNEVNQLSPGGDFSALTDVNTELDAVNTLLSSYDIPAIADMANSAFEGIPNRVQNYSTDVVADVKKLLADNKDVFANLSASLDGQVKVIANNTEVYQDVATQYLMKFVVPNNMYRWYAGLGLCCLVLLVVVFNLLGLIFGLCSYNSDHTPTTRTCGSTTGGNLLMSLCSYNSNHTPTTRTCGSTTGGNLLMSSVGFAFLFCWLLMLLVTIFFLVGSPMERFVCRPLETQEIFAETIDKPYFLQTPLSSNNNDTQSGTPAPSPKYLLGQLLLQDDQIPLKAGDILRNCSDNKGLLAVLQLDRYSFGGTDTSDLLDQINNINIDDQLDTLDVDFSTVKVLDQDTRDSMTDFRDSGVSNIDFDAYLAEVNKGLTQVDLPTYAQGLRTAADNFQEGSNVINGVRNNADRIDQLQTTKVVPLLDDVDKLKTNIQQLKQTVSDLQTSIDALLDSAQTAETYLQTQGGDAVKDFNEDFGGCKPVSDAYQSVVLLLCSYFLDAFNGFWFGLGWCLLFYVPSMIFGVKLAKHYRRMDYETGYDDYDYRYENVPMSNMDRKQPSAPPAWHRAVLHKAP